MHKSISNNRPSPRLLKGKQCVNIHVPIDKGLGVSPTVCTHILIETIKYLIYQKQQIPYPYLHLKDIATQFGIQSDEKTQPKMSPICRPTKQNLQAVQAYKSLEEIFQKLESELNQSSSDGTQEVVVLMGATPMSPQDVYHIQLPLLTLSTALCDTTASVRQSLILLIRSLTASTSLNEIFSKPMAPTNTYVLLKKNVGDTCEWFLPKDRYNVPNRGNQIFICLRQPLSEQKKCMLTCSSITPAFQNIDLCRPNVMSIPDCDHPTELTTSKRRNPIRCIAISKTCDFAIYEDNAARKSNSPSHLCNYYKLHSNCKMAYMSEGGGRSLQEGTCNPTSDQVTSSRWYQSCTFLKGFK